jgi:uncharacterized protein (DUF983 family)
MDQIAWPGAHPAFFTSLARGFRLRCPRCGHGALLRGAYGFRMRRECPVCGLDYFREPGYYVGAMIINYGITVVLIVGAYLISTFMREVWHTSSDWKILAWMGASIVISLSIVPLSRSLWLAIDYWVEPWANKTQAK